MGRLRRHADQSAQSGKDSATNRKQSAANRQCQSSHGCRRYSRHTNSLAVIPRAGQCLRTGKEKPTNLNNVLNRQILPVLNRCGICRESKRTHVAAQNSHKYTRDGSLPEWHGFHSFRRGLASTLYGLGVDDVMVQQIMRHQDVGVTRKHYIKTVPEQSVSAMAKLEAALCADRALSTAPVKSTLPN